MIMKGEKTFDVKKFQDSLPKKIGNYGNCCPKEEIKVGELKEKKYNYDDNLFINKKKKTLE